LRIIALVGETDEQEHDAGSTADIEAVTERITSAGLANGAVVVGVAAASAFNEYVPAGHRPEDFLPGARSVVVAGALGPSNAAWQSPNRRLMEITGYDFRENVASLVMGDMSEAEYGHLAIQAPALPNNRR
jgi:epoxyqueuosine reductase QueG